MWWDGRSQDTSPPEVSGCCGQPWWFSQGYNVTIQIWCYDHSPHFTLHTPTLTSVGWKLSNLMVDGNFFDKCQMLEFRLTPSLMFRSSLQSLWHDSHLDAPVSSWGGCWLSWWSPTAVVPSRGMSQWGAGALWSNVVTIWTRTWRLDLLWSCLSGDQMCPVSGPLQSAVQRSNTRRPSWGGYGRG